jgi:CheY-like chemotaxis protein
LSNQTILFADDSATMRAIMEKAFAAEPYDVVAVPTGDAALARAIELKPDVIIADATMLGTSGYEVCEKIKGDPGLESIPVILMAGVSHPYDEARGKAVGADLYMKKPFDTTQLLEKVGSLTSGAGAAASAPKSAAQVPAPPKLAPEPVTPTAPKPSPPVPKPPIKPAALPTIPEAPRRFSAPSLESTPKESPARQPKKTMEFGRPKPEANFPVQSGAEHPASEPAASVQPRAGADVKPIDIGDTSAASAGPDTFQVGTLAELAQVDSKGSTIAMADQDDAIELPETSPKPQKSPDPIPLEKPASSIATMNESIEREVASRAADIDGVSPEQVKAIEALTKDVVERVVWEVVPDIAEVLIKEELAKLLQE